MKEAIGIVMPSLKELEDAFMALPTSLAMKHLTPAVRSSTEPAIAALRSKVGKGASGRLSKSIASKVKTYKQDRTVLGLVGFKYVKEGTRKTIHQVFQEFGTKERETHGSVASSYNRKKFKIIRNKGWSANNLGGHKYTLQPASRYNFYYKNWTGGTVKTGRVKPNKYLEEAWIASESGVKAELQAQLYRRLGKAIKEFAYRQSRKDLRF